MNFIFVLLGAFQNFSKDSKNGPLQFYLQDAVSQYNSVLKLNKLYE